MDILTILNKTLNIPQITKHTGDNKVYLNRTKNPIGTYCTYAVLNEKTSYYDESEDKETEYFIQIDIFSDTNYYQLLKEIQKQLKLNGFYKDEIVEVFDDKYKYHKVLRYYYYLNVEF